MIQAAGVQRGACFGLFPFVCVCVRARVCVTLCACVVVRDLGEYSTCNMHHDKNGTRKGGIISYTGQERRAGRARVVASDERRFFGGGPCRDGTRGFLSQCFFLHCFVKERWSAMNYY